jgi:hypothetical protein
MWDQKASSGARVEVGNALCIAAQDFVLLSL